jgi:hypothetical protein
VPVSQHDVDELRREGQALSLDDVDHTLRTNAEVIAYLIYGSRSIGADQAEQLRLVELLVRAVEMTRENIREARDVLQALSYPPELTQLLTALARKAKPEPPSWIERIRRRPRLP